MRILFLIVTIISVMTVARSAEHEKMAIEKPRSAYKGETALVGANRMQAKRDENKTGQKVFLTNENIEKEEKHHKEKYGKPIPHLPPIEIDKLMSDEDNVIDTLEKDIENEIVQKPEIGEQEMIPTPMSTSRLSEKHTQNSNAPVATSTSTAGFVVGLKNISFNLLPDNEDIFVEGASNETVRNVTLSLGTRVKTFLRTNPFLSGFFISLDVILLLVIVFAARYSVQYSKRFFTSTSRKTEASRKTSKHRLGSSAVFFPGPVPRLTFVKPIEDTTVGVTSKDDITKVKSDSRVPVVKGSARRMSSRSRSLRSQMAQRASSVESTERDVYQPLIKQHLGQTEMKKSKTKRMSFFQSFAHALPFGRKNSDIAEAADSELEQVITDGSKGRKTSVHDKDTEVLRHVVASNLNFHMQRESEEEDLESLRSKALTTGDRRVDQMLTDGDFRRSIFGFHGFDTTGGRPSSSMLNYGIGYREAMDFGRIKRAKSFGTIHSDSSDSF